MTVAVAPEVVRSRDAASPPSERRVVRRTRGAGIGTILSLLVLVALAAAGAWGWYHYRGGAPPLQYRTAAVTRGELRVGISATGTLEPEEVIDVGAQVAGQIDKFGTDPGDGSKPVDYGTAVEEGTVLTHIDDSLYAADVEGAKAELEVAGANVQRAEADLGQMRAKLFQAERDWERAQRLRPSGAITQTDYDAAQAAEETAKSALAVGEASVVQAQKTVLQAQASLKRAERNLNYCTIKSPVKGVIIDRRVNVGQTVVSSLNAPSLFLIAKDLKRMEVWASVNEADIGMIHPGQKVRFTVDAYPGEVFLGTVDKVRLNATMTQNVVTYTVEVTTDNSSGKLLPYLTANLQFEVDQRSSALLAPNAALRWKPQPAEAAPAGRLAGPPNAASAKDHGHGTVYIRDGNQARPIPVQTGLSDGQNTEILGGDVKEGSEVIVGEVAANAGEGTTNPFAPRLFSGGGGTAGGAHP